MPSHDGQGKPEFDSEVAILLEAAAARGVEAEVYVSRSQATKVAVQDGEVETFTLTGTRGVGVRVIHEGRVGYAFTESLAADALVAVVSDAAANAAVLEPDEAAGLGEFRDEAPELPLYNPGLADVPVPRKIAAALAIDKAARGADSRVKTVTGVGYGDISASVRIASTRGVDRFYRESLAWGHCVPIVTEAGQNKTYARRRNYRDFEAFSPEEIASEAVGRCVEKLGAREIPSGRYDVVFHPEAFSDLLEVFSSIFSAKVAQEGKSLLRGRTGETLSSPALTLIDDPLLVSGFGSRPFDDEGCASRPFTLIERGVFRGFLHNVQTARKDGVETTGHAARGGYSGVMHVRPSNLVVQAGSESREKLLSCSPRVLQVTEVTGLHAGASVISGDFSLQAQGFVWEGGERYPAHLFTVSGNFYDLLRAIEAVGNDVEIQPSGTATPSVLVRGMAIAGK